LTENYDSLSLRRNGRVLAALPGSEGSYRDRPPLGLAAYEVVALRGGSESLPAACSLLVEVPRPPPITDFACADSGGAFALSWRNGAEYDAVALFRSGMLIAELAGTTQSYSEPFRSSLLTIYTLEGRAGGAETLPATCALNNIASASVRAEEVTAAPGEPLVPIRIYATHAFPVIAYQVSLDIDPARARLRAVTLSGTAAEAIGYDFFRYTLAEEVGELSAGIILDFTPPFDSLLPSGADHHILTVIVDALGAGSTPVRFVERPERKGTPAQKTIFTDTNAQSIRVSIRDGLLLVGESPLPPVLHAAALLGGEAGGGGAGGGAGPGEEVLLRWRNALRYDSVRIERDGALLSELAGEAESFRDASPGPGIHRYRITAVKDGVASFPAVVVALPRGIPGTFIRGDADADGRLNLTDAVAMLNYLFLDGALPPCLDAADADDSGGIDLTDPVTALNYLFLGSRPLPPPGPGARWFDPTADGLTCE
jgi:hypothetical protein